MPLPLVVIRRTWPQIPRPCCWLDNPEVYTTFQPCSLFKTAYRAYGQPDLDASVLLVCSTHHRVGSLCIPYECHRLWP